MPLPELELYRNQFAQIQSDAQELTSGLDELRFNWRPAPGAWSIEECLYHLILVGQWEVRAIERAIEQGRRRGLTASGPFEYSAVDRFVVDQTEPPVRNPMPAPERFVPVHGQPVTAILPTFLHVQSQFLGLVDQSENLDLRRIKVDTPISRFFRLSLGTVFAQAAAHNRRHLWQARRVREKMP